MKRHIVNDRFSDMRPFKFLFLHQTPLSPVPARQIFLWSGRSVTKQSNLIKSRYLNTAHISVEFWTRSKVLSVIKCRDLYLGFGIFFAGVAVFASFANGNHGLCRKEIKLDFLMLNRHKFVRREISLVCLLAVNQYSTEKKKDLCRCSCINQTRQRVTI